MWTQDIVDTLASRMAEKEPLIQIIIGPRQVGKTTSIGQLIKADKKNKYHFVSGDGVPQSQWIREQWQEALTHNRVLVIDEIQKIPDWSETIKALWDQQKKSKLKMKCILLGSSSLYLQKGMSESLTGRFELIRARHWTYFESTRISKMSFEEYLLHGGYPGSYAQLEDIRRWKDYIVSSVLETVIMKDILSQARVKSPALFRQAFYIYANHPAQVLSYNKVLGQLQDKGNIDLVKYYLELFEAAFLLKAIPAFTKNEVRKRSLSPKVISMAPCLSTFDRLDRLDSEYKGRVFENLVGTVLVAHFDSVFYWASDHYEVDYIVQIKGKIVAIEVKSDRPRRASSLSRFLEKYPSALSVFITKSNFPMLEKDPKGFIGKILGL